MKKLLKGALATVLSLGLVACSSKPKATTTIESFLSAMQSGNYTKCLTFFDTSMLDTFTSTYSYNDLFDTSSANSEALEALDELISTTLKASCVSYTIGDTTKEDDNKYTVSATIEYVDFDSTDTSSIEEDLVSQYQITTDMVAELEDEELGNLLIVNISKYTTELMKYGLENGTKLSSESIFTVEKIDNDWLITGIN